MLNTGIIPNVVTVTTLCNMWSTRDATRHPGAAEAVDALYDTILDADWTPDGRLYRALHRAMLPYSSRPVVAKKLESLLLKSVNFGNQPDILSFQIVLNAWIDCVPRDKPNHSNDGSVSRAIAILDLMGTQGIRPAKSLFQPLISAVAKLYGHTTIGNNKKGKIRDVPAEYSLVLASYIRAGFYISTRMLNQQLYVHCRNYRGDDSIKACEIVIDSMLHYGYCCNGSDYEHDYLLLLSPQILLVRLRLPTNTTYYYYDSDCCYYYNYCYGCDCH